MKTNILKISICSIALCVASLVASAQVKDLHHDFSAFDSIEIENDFYVNVLKSKRNNDYSIAITADDILIDYIQTYVKNHTLYIGLNKKALPSDIKKLYKGRKTPNPTLNATVYMASELTGVKMSGAAVLTVENEIECKDFEADLSDNSQLKKLSVDASTFSIKTANKSFADIIVYADDIKVDASGNSQIQLEQDSQTLYLTVAGSAIVNAEGETLEAALNTNGTSKTTLIGKTDVINVTGAGASFVDAINFKAAECGVKLTGSCKVVEAASESPHIDASGNSTLIFDGDPAIDIINIKSSTVQRYENK